MYSCKDEGGEERKKRVWKIFMIQSNTKSEEKRYRIDVDKFVCHWPTSIYDIWLMTFKNVIFCVCLYFVSAVVFNLHFLPCYKFITSVKLRSIFATGFIMFVLEKYFDEIVMNDAWIEDLFSHCKTTVKCIIFNIWFQII